MDVAHEYCWQESQISNIYLKSLHLFKICYFFFFFVKAEVVVNIEIHLLTEQRRWEVIEVGGAQGWVEKFEFDLTKQGFS